MEVLSQTVSSELNFMRKNTKVNKDLKSLKKQNPIMNNSMNKIESGLVEEKLDYLLMHIDELERKLSVKADDVVSYQVLQHRSELDHLFVIMKNIEERMGKIEKSLNPIHKKEEVASGEEIQIQPITAPRKKKRRLLF